MLPQGVGHTDKYNHPPLGMTYSLPYSIPAKVKPLFLHAVVQLCGVRLPRPYCWLFKVRRPTVSFQHPVGYHPVNWKTLRPFGPPQVSLLLPLQAILQRPSVWMVA